MPQEPIEIPEIGFVRIRRIATGNRAGRYVIEANTSGARTDVPSVDAAGAPGHWRSLHGGDFSAAQISRIRLVTRELTDTERSSLHRNAPASVTIFCDRDSARLIRLHGLITIDNAAHAVVGFSGSGSIAFRALNRSTQPTADNLRGFTDTTSDTLLRCQMADTRQTRDQVIQNQTIRGLEQDTIDALLANNPRAAADHISASGPIQYQNLINQHRNVAMLLRGGAPLANANTISPGTTPAPPPPAPAAQNPPAQQNVVVVVQQPGQQRQLPPRPRLNGNERGLTPQQISTLRSDWANWHDQAADFYQGLIDQRNRAAEALRGMASEPETLRNYLDNHRMPETPDAGGRLRPPAAGRRTLRDLLQNGDTTQQDQVIQQIIQRFSVGDLSMGSPDMNNAVDQVRTVLLDQGVSSTQKIALNTTLPIPTTVITRRDSSANMPDGGSIA